VVISGILTIAVADAFSDALGMHISAESENQYTSKEIWEITITTFLSKLFFASTFLIPFLLFDINLVFWLSVVWGMFVLIYVSYQLALSQKLKSIVVIREHVLIASVVLFLDHYLGHLIAYYIN